MQAAAGRAGGSAAARTGRPQGLEAARGAARRDRACEPADHRARPADLPHGLWPADGAAGCVSDPEGRKRAAGRHGAANPVGAALETLLRERVFEPLGMEDTAFSVPATKLDRLATSYQVNPETGALELYDEAEGGQWSRPPAFPSAGGGLVSTIDDYLAFGQMMLNKGNYGSGRLLSRPSIETMTTDQLTPEQKAVSAMVPGYFDNHGWGFGLSIVTRPNGMAEPIGRYGWDGGL